ncbi:hypothetical protein Mlaev_01244 [Microbacterium laevaniformans]|uniref:Uncharacterized protein n=1 Tax=Microbacterium laevaniformans TaxID=36807 RepID=A0A150HFU3_9MICO|nr:hypothetical protein Mlaev_01244 [Microbacterium laevaniformans]
MIGAVVTRIVATALATAPPAVVNTARTWVPSLFTVAFSASSGAVSPAMSLKRVAPAGRSCHCTCPEPVAWKAIGAAAVPAGSVSVRSAGSAVTTGAVPTRSRRWIARREVAASVTCTMTAPSGSTANTSRLSASRA